VPLPISAPEPAWRRLEGLGKGGVDSVRAVNYLVPLVSVFLQAGSLVILVGQGWLTSERSDSAESLSGHRAIHPEYFRSAIVSAQASPLAAVVCLILRAIRAVSIPAGLVGRVSFRERVHWAKCSEERLPAAKLGRV
jgi:hypothetical protein